MTQTLPLIELFGKKFNIPHYQRGYRWGKQEVEELLNDLLEFSKPLNKGLFYCLQPIVVLKKDENEYDVLDGQQRLTTLYLILMYLEDRRFEDNYDEEIFSLNYETRKDSEIFLQERKYQGEISEENIDFYHISKSFHVIEQWFKENRGAKSDLLPILMKSNDGGHKNVRFIWYEVENDENPIDIFIRLNVGKIPLTDAELVKALLLQTDAYEEKDLEFINGQLFEIASEWDDIEYNLQKEELWFFLNNGTNNQDTHIEFIFDLIAKRYNEEEIYFEKIPSKHSTFLIFQKKLESLIDNGESRLDAVKLIWEDVTVNYEYFKNWFEDRELFHHIGFLIWEKREGIIKDLIEKSKNLRKSEFKGFLTTEIFKLVDLSQFEEESEKPLKIEEFEEEELNKYILKSNADFFDTMMRMINLRIRKR